LFDFSTLSTFEVPMPEPPKVPLLIVTIECARQWGDNQQVSLDTLFHWSGRVTPPEAARQLIQAVTEAAKATGTGEVQAVSQSGQTALDSFGDSPQLPLLACPIPEPKA
jgi:hypothetical protein